VVAGPDADTWRLVDCSIATVPASSRTPASCRPQLWRSTCERHHPNATRGVVLPLLEAIGRPGVRGPPRALRCLGNGGRTIDIGTPAEYWNDPPLRAARGTSLPRRAASSAPPTTP
jgi:hypothetical protein